MMTFGRRRMLAAGAVLAVSTSAARSPAPYPGMRSASSAASRRAGRPTFPGACWRGASTILIKHPPYPCCALQSLHILGRALF